MRFSAEFTLINRIGNRMPAWHCTVTDGQTGKKYYATAAELDIALLNAVDNMDRERVGY